MSVHALGLLLQTVLEMSRKLVCYLLVNAAPASFCENRDIPADQNNYLFDGMRIIPLVSFFAILNLSSTIRCIYYSFVITISTCTYNTLSKGSAFWKLSSFKLRSATFMIKKNGEDKNCATSKRIPNWNLKFFNKTIWHYAKFVTYWDTIESYN